MPSDQFENDQLVLAVELLSHRTHPVSNYIQSNPPASRPRQNIYQIKLLR